MYFLEDLDESESSSFESSDSNAEDYYTNEYPDTPIESEEEIINEDL